MVQTWTQELGEDVRDIDALLACTRGLGKQKAKTSETVSAEDKGTGKKKRKKKKKKQQSSSDDEEMNNTKKEEAWTADFEGGVQQNDTLTATSDEDILAGGFDFGTKIEKADSTKPSESANDDDEDWANFGA